MTALAYAFSPVALHVGHGDVRAHRGEHQAGALAHPETAAEHEQVLALESEYLASSSVAAGLIRKWFDVFLALARSRAPIAWRRRQLGITRRFCSSHGDIIGSPARASSARSCSQVATVPYVGVPAVS